MSPELVKTIVLGVFATLVIGAAVRDLATFTIPNWISLALAAGFAPAALLAGVPLPEIGVSFAVGVGMLVVGAGMFAVGWIGGGDAKLMAAAAIWVGLRGLPPFAIYTALAGGALALGLVALRSAWLRPLAAAGPSWTQRLATPGESAPYGVAIAAGALAAFALHPLL
ncbi:MAG TPA: prepilin peptidase [Caulobacteraceae bacterium]|nr:prepilin peptidase [Caulobacteraceae bacterium]